jgi:hypothetical protein
MLQKVYFLFLQAWVSSLVEIPHDFFLLFPRLVKFQLALSTALEKRRTKKSSLHPPFLKMCQMGESQFTVGRAVVRSFHFGQDPHSRFQDGLDPDPT